MMHNYVWTWTHLHLTSRMTDVVVKPKLEIVPSGLYLKRTESEKKQVCYFNDALWSKIGKNTDKIVI